MLDSWGIMAEKSEKWFENGSKMEFRAIFPVARALCPISRVRRKSIFCHFLPQLGLEARNGSVASPRDCKQKCLLLLLLLLRLLFLYVCSCRMNVVMSSHCFDLLLLVCLFVCFVWFVCCCCYFEFVHCQHLGSRLVSFSSYDSSCASSLVCL